jgi:hypothetical protein
MVKIIKNICKYREHVRTTWSTYIQTWSQLIKSMVNIYIQPWSTIIKHHGQQSSLALCFAALYHYYVLVPRLSALLLQLCSTIEVLVLVLSTLFCSTTALVSTGTSTSTSTCTSTLFCSTAALVVVFVTK